MDIEEEEAGLKGVPMLIRCDAGEKQYAKGTFRFDQEGFDYAVLEGPQFHFTYEDTCSIGTYQLELVIFLDAEQEPDATEQPQFELFKLIQQSDGAMGQQHFQMKGPYEIRLDLAPYGKETLAEVFGRMKEISITKMEQADNEEEFPDLDNMITADDIDEHGNIINKAKLLQEGEQQDQELEKQHS